MNRKISAIAKLISANKEQYGRKCIVMLGAGASISSGVKLSRDLMEELLAKWRPDLSDGPLRDRFDDLWRSSNPNQREMILKPYLDLPPSSGFSDLARLIIQGYFDKVITFNFDQLLEKALRAEGFNDFLVVVRGECASDVYVRQQMDRDEPRVKILKMHGGIKGGDTFLYTREEMNQYPQQINEMLLDLTRGYMIVCGYSFEDQCVVRAFAQEGDSVYCANPGGAPPNLGPVLIKRYSKDWVIDKDDGKFDAFFGDLYRELTAAPVVYAAPKANPFKFLVSYEVRDGKSFHGREDLTEDALKRFQSVPPQKLIGLFGKSKVGKTSFVRAGLIAHLDTDKFEPVYLRCQGPLDSWLPRAVSKICTPAAPGVEAAIKALSATTSKHLVIVIDQFERVAGANPDKDPGKRQLEADLQMLNRCNCPNVSFLCVGVETTSFLSALAKGKVDVVEVTKLAAEAVASIIARLAQDAGIQFQADVIEALVRRYDEAPDGSREFTLAHVQAVCNILAGSSLVDMEHYEKVISSDEDALHVVLNVNDIVSWVEDIEDEVRRNMFRKVMKVVPVESKKLLAAYLRAHFSDLLTPPEFEAQP